MNDNDKEQGLGKKVADGLTWAAILYLFVLLLGWLFERKWGAFLIIAVIATLGSALLIAMVLGLVFEMIGDPDLCCDDAIYQGELIAGGVVGVIIAAVAVREDKADGKNPK